MTNELAIKENTLPESGELTPTSLAAEQQFEIQSAITIAKKFPRDEDTSSKMLMKACGRKAFAEDATYAFPRGGSTISGPSVNLAREGARTWGNIRYGCDIVREDEISRLIRGWAWDMETNTRVSAEDQFKKLIQRKAGKETIWIKPDERDLRELTNRRAAILIRNSILQLLPKDLIEDALEAAKATLKKTVKQDPEAVNKMINAFLAYRVNSSMIEKRLGHDPKKATPEELEELRGIFNSIRDGNSTVEEYFDVAGANQEDKPAATKSEELARQLKPEGKLE